MLRLLALTLAIIVPARGWCEESDDSRNITRGRQQIFAPLSRLAPDGNAGMFVGVNNFTHDRGLTKLGYAVHDAVETAHLFAFELKLIRPDQCHILLSGTPDNKVVQQHLDQLRQQGAMIGDADRTEILRTFLAVSRIASKESDLMVCSFSSHGFEDRGDGYVMPADGIRAILADTAVPLKTIERNMERSQAGHRLLLVDACQERVSAKGSSHAGDPAGQALIAALQKPSGQAKLASCSPGEFSYEHGSLGDVGHGVFTWAFLEALRGGAKADKEHLVRLGSVAEYVAARVSGWTTENQRKKQTPFLKSPVETRRLPLAEKADDLTTLIANLKQQRDGGAFTAATRDALVVYLGNIDPANPEDRELLATTREFVSGQLRVSLFVGFVERDRKRWRAVPPPPPQLRVLLEAPFTTDAIRAARRNSARQLGVDEALTNSIGMKLALIPPGTFMMGSPAAESQREDHEAAHPVQITRPYFIGTHEVTQGQYFAVMDSNPSLFSRAGEESRLVAGVDTGDFPVENVSWLEATTFCNRLSELTNEKAEKRRYRLPTEAEWEYACRAGTTSPFSFGSACDGSQVNCDGSFPYRTIPGRFHARTTPVASYAANPFGAFDMHGNVWEWCLDRYTDDYENLPSENPLCDDRESARRVLRGGGWFNDPSYCRSASRSRAEETARAKFYGFRVVCEQY